MGSLPADPLERFPGLGADFLLVGDVELDFHTLQVLRDGNPARVIAPNSISVTRIIISLPFSCKPISIIRIISASRVSITSWRIRRRSANVIFDRYIVRPSRYYLPLKFFFTLKNLSQFVQAAQHKDPGSLK